MLRCDSLLSNNWSMKKGQKMAGALLYAPLPENVEKMVEKTIKSIKY